MVLRADRGQSLFEDSDIELLIASITLTEFGRRMLALGASLEDDGPIKPTDPERRGRLFEMAAGAELLQLPGEIFYWREKQAEVDFIYKDRGRLYAIEVKSGRKKTSKGLGVFMEKFPHAARLIVTPENFPEFSQAPAQFLAKVAGN